MLRKMDGFTKNVIIVFAGTSLVNLFNLLYQLMIAHKLSVSSYASFNSLLSIFYVISAPLITVQLAITKYSAELAAHNQINKIKFLVSDLLKKTSFLAVITFFIFWFIFGYIINLLKIPSIYSGFILAALLALSWLVPIFSSVIQGLEMFGWLTAISVITGALKLALAYLAIKLGYSIGGALGALLVSTLAVILISYFPLRSFVSIKAVKETVNYKEIFIYLFPVAIGSLCFVALVNSDIILVKYFFPADAAGKYSLAQMVGKVFLFLPSAISVVMFPKTSGQNAKKMDTTSTLKKSLFYVLALCIFAYILYTFFPSFVLMMLTGKVFPESILLGRLFGISMTFFALLYTLSFYFLSIKDLRFIKLLVLFTILQNSAIILFHKSLINVQMILCLSAILLFFSNMSLVYKKR